MRTLAIVEGGNLDFFLFFCEVMDQSTWTLRFTRPVKSLGPVKAQQN